MSHEFLDHATIIGRSRQDGEVVRRPVPEERTAEVHVIDVTATVPSTQSDYEMLTTP